MGCKWGWFQVFQRCCWLSFSLSSLNSASFCVILILISGARAFFCCFWWIWWSLLGPTNSPLHHNSKSMRYLFAPSRRSIPGMMPSGLAEAVCLFLRVEGWNEILWLALLPKMVWNRKSLPQSKGGLTWVEGWRKMGCLVYKAAATGHSGVQRWDLLREGEVIFQSTKH